MVTKNPHEMSFKEYCIASNKFYELHGNVEWMSSVYHVDVTQETHNEGIKLGLSTIGTFYRQHMKNHLMAAKSVL